MESSEQVSFTVRGAGREVECRFDAADLDLSGMGLTKLPVGLERCSRLESLDLSRNVLSSLERSAEYVPKYFPAKDSSDLPSSPQERNTFLYRLHHQRSTQQVRRLPESLRRLNVSVNRLHRLEGLPPGLRELNASNNFLRSLDGLPAGLRSVDLRHNFICDLPNKGRLPKKLERVDLRHNGVAVRCPYVLQRDYWLKR